MTDRTPFYITTTLPYVNAEPHIGFAMEIVRADAVARYRALSGAEVFFNTGTDEHGLKIFRNASEAGQDPQSYVDGYALKFKALIPLLSLTPDINFIRTTDAHHVAAAQEFWKIVDHNGYIYKKSYRVKYCVGCELEKTDSELVEGKCPIHPNRELEQIDEENYFFKFSAFTERLLALYGERPDLVIPDFRFNEIKAFVSRGLEDFSISRLREKMPWGVPVPGDGAHVMYVWFDALVNYISALGWPSDLDRFNHFWVKTGGVVQYCGKDNLRQQSAMWQAMLMAAGLPPSRHIIIDGFITSGGQKMSKSLGNVISPKEVVAAFGSDTLRYVVLRELSSFEDGDVTMEGIKAAYNANLANGVGNLVSRVMKMATGNSVPFDPAASAAFKASPFAKDIYRRYTDAFTAYDLKRAADAVWELIGATDALIQERAPFKKVKTDPQAAYADIRELMARIETVGVLLAPLLPATAERIVTLVRGNTMPDAPLFPRKD